MLQRDFSYTEEWKWGRGFKIGYISNFRFGKSLIAVQAMNVMRRNDDATGGTAAGLKKDIV